MALSSRRGLGVPLCPTQSPGLAGHGLASQLRARETQTLSRGCPPTIPAQPHGCTDDTAQDKAPQGWPGAQRRSQRLWHLSEWPRGQRAAIGVGPMELQQGQGPLSQSGPQAVGPVLPVATAQPAFSRSSRLPPTPQRRSASPRPRRPCGSLSLATAPATQRSRKPELSSVPGRRPPRITQAGIQHPETRCQYIILQK